MSDKARISDILIFHECRGEKKDFLLTTANISLFCYCVLRPQTVPIFIGCRREGTILRPRAYESRALTNWATSTSEEQNKDSTDICFFRILSKHSLRVNSIPLQQYCRVTSPSVDYCHFDNLTLLRDLESNQGLQVMSLTRYRSSIPLCFFWTFRLWV